MSVNYKTQSTAFFNGKDLSKSDFDAACQEAKKDLDLLMLTMGKVSKPEVVELAGLISSKIATQVAPSKVTNQTLENAADLPYAPGPANGV